MALLRRTVPPFALLFLYFFVASLVAARIAGRGRMLLFNLAFVFLALGLFESVMSARSLSQDAFYKSPSFDARIVSHPELGYAAPPQAGQFRDVKRAPDGSVVFEAEYGVDANGLRVTPAKPGAPVYFFGDSFVFGEGINDAETLPHQYAELTGRQTFNLAMPGYGPHQMLRMLELDLPAQLGMPAPADVVYVAITAHIDRAAGRAYWDVNGPFYEVVGGTAQYLGPSGSVRPSSVWMQYLFGRSEIWSRIVRPQLELYGRDHDRERFVAIVATAARHAKQRWGASFRAVIWDVGPWIRPRDIRDADWIERELAQRGVTVIRVSRDDPKLDDDRYYIPIDGHPNGAGFARLAALLARQERSNAVATGTR